MGCQQPRYLNQIHSISNPFSILNSTPSPDPTPTIPSTPIPKATPITNNCPPNTHPLSYQPTSIPSESNHTPIPSPNTLSWTNSTTLTIPNKPPSITPNHTTKIYNYYCQISKSQSTPNILYNPHLIKVFKKKFKLPHRLKIFLK